MRATGRQKQLAAAGSGPRDHQTAATLSVGRLSQDAYTSGGLSCYTTAGRGHLLQQDGTFCGHQGIQTGRSWKETGSCAESNH